MLIGDVADIRNLRIILVVESFILRCLECFMSDSIKEISFYPQANVTFAALPNL